MIRRNAASGHCIANIRIVMRFAYPMMITSIVYSMLSASILYVASHHRDQAAGWVGINKYMRFL